MYKFGSEDWMRQLLVSAGWERDYRFGKDGLWHRPGSESYTTIETACCMELRFPEQVRQKLCPNEKVDQ